MYRKRKHSGSGGILNLDSLMDILSCLVGVMLFMVIYTVLELGATAYQVEMPVDRDEPPGARQIVVFCVDGTVRVLDARTSLSGLIVGMQTTSFAEVPGFVQAANLRAFQDDFFQYTLAYEDRADAMGARSRLIMLQIDQQPGVVGDSIHQIGEGSGYDQILAGLSTSNTWVEFAVDSESLEIFRQARQMATARGLVTGWNPVGEAFPLHYPLTAGGRLDLGPEAVLTKPLR